MIKQTLKEWREEAIEKFGEDAGNWKFKCPACGHVSSVKDFKELGDDGNSAYQECIGRHNGKGTNGMKGKDEGHGCNWAGYGLFGNLGKGRIVITPEGKEIEVFDFADKEVL
ncbi:hypothetical protein EXN25_05840 [Clostridium botulinum]|uniref:VVA0879 family protein n=1 Tax=Clostridium botulinum TaxID=1491 RepID=UPI0001F84C9F|nr:VVA0879 family protein [Clostridium botulinum]NFB16252.1 hypothetical protein [Clostridium botulinum]NFB67138.1 hypothetical protein [Clostridium botulinum]NFB96727.1 hypothetical protein [Clostridium botulinum]NFC57426.1 hypothetical protein [Clostridium botulinum]NFC83637.1 hypothetical protein [Clostridium botulinum]